MSESRPLFVRTVYPPPSAPLATHSVSECVQAFRSYLASVRGARDCPEVLAREDDEDDTGPEGRAPGAENSHAGALALSKITEALKGLSQEDLQSRVKGRPLRDRYRLTTELRPLPRST